MKISAKFQRGETFRLALAVLNGGDASTATAPSAVVKKALDGLQVPPLATPAAFTFTVTFRAAAGDVAAGFDLVAAAGLTAALAPGIYCVNLQFTVSGEISKSQHLFFEIEDSAT